MPAQAEVKTPLTAKPVVCPICGNGMSKQLYRFEPALWIPGRVVRCSECRTIYKVLADSAKPLGEYYGDAFAALDYWNQEEAALNAFRKIWNALALTLTPSGLSPRTMPNQHSTRVTTTPTT